MKADEAARLRAALAALEQDDFPAAERLCAAPGTPRGAEAEFIRALAVGGAGRHAEAGRLLDRLARPGLAHPRRDLGDLLARNGQHAAAARQYRAALRHTPDDAAAHHALGVALAEQGQVAAAGGAFRRTTQLDPDQAAGWSNLGMMLKIQGRADAALAAHDHAVTRAPHDAQIRVNRAVALLYAGRLTEAWQDYEWRLLLAGHPALPLAALLPNVADLDLSGRTVLVWHEEGFGDTIQFARYAPMLAARGARVLLAVPAPLVRLMHTLPDVTVTDPAAPLPAHDFHCPVFSLPRAFGTTMESIPAGTPYLLADPALAAAWAARLPPEGLRVGVVWAGQARPWLPGFATMNTRRSIVPAAFRRLGDIPGVRLISLQHGAPAPTGFHDPMPAVTDFADTAAIIVNLDLVVSVDTSVVHLAGALGAPVLLLDRHDNCWRWFSGRTDSPWYPSLRILRQERMGDWSGPLRDAAAIVAQAAARKAPSSAPRNAAIAPGPERAVPATPAFASASAL